MSDTLSLAATSSAALFPNSLPPCEQGCVQGAHSGPVDSSITTTSSTLKMAAVRAICPAMAVASSDDCTLSMAAADTAMETVRCRRLVLVPESGAVLQMDRIAGDQ